MRFLLGPPRVFFAILFALEFGDGSLSVVPSPLPEVLGRTGALYTGGKGCHSGACSLTTLGGVPIGPAAGTTHSPVCNSQWPHVEQISLGNVAYSPGTSALHPGHRDGSPRSNGIIGGLG